MCDDFYDFLFEKICFEVVKKQFLLSFRKKQKPPPPPHQASRNFRWLAGVVRFTAPVSVVGGFLAQNLFLKNIFRKNVFIKNHFPKKQTQTPQPPPPTRVRMREVLLQNHAGEVGPDAFLEL